MNRAVVPHMRRCGKGLIIHVTSTSGRSVVPGMGMYAATKFATEALAEAYRYELSSFGVDSVILEPGPYATDVFDKKELPADLERLKDYEKLWKKMSAVFETIEAKCKNPQEVADAILRIIETPAGERPLRQIIGPAVPQLHDLNDISSRVQREILEYLAIGDWLGIPGSPGRAMTTLRFGWGGGRIPGKRN
jgi:short-subunit dehydrogenase